MDKDRRPVENLSIAAAHVHSLSNKASRENRSERDSGSSFQPPVEHGGSPGKHAAAAGRPDRRRHLRPHGRDRAGADAALSPGALSRRAAQARLSRRGAFRLHEHSLRHRHAQHGGMDHARAKPLRLRGGRRPGDPVRVHLIAPRHRRIADRGRGSPLRVVELFSRRPPHRKKRPTSGPTRSTAFYVNMAARTAGSPSTVATPSAPRGS